MENLLNIHLKETRDKMVSTKSNMFDVISNFRSRVTSRFLSTTATAASTSTNIDSKVYQSNTLTITQIDSNISPNIFQSDSKHSTVKAPPVSKIPKPSKRSLDPKRTSRNTLSTPGAETRSKGFTKSASKPQLKSTAVFKED